MTSENKVWETLKAEYLKKVEKALSSVKHPHIAEVLEDVQSHLNERFAGLEPEQRTPKNLKIIISEMGPAVEYAELLASGTVPAEQNKSRQKYLLRIGLAVIMFVSAIIFLRMIISPKIKGPRLLTISGAYWFHSNDRPHWIPENAVPKDSDGHILFHVDEWFEGMTTAQFEPFLSKADKHFILKADGYPDVHANAERGCWSQEFYIRIPRKDYVKMVSGIPYTIHPVNSNPKYQWKVVPGVTITKPDQ
jgi:hypothetical protein